MYIEICIYSNICTSTRMQSYPFTHMYVHVYTCVQVWVCEWACVRVYKGIFVCVCLCMCSRKRIRTSYKLCAHCRYMYIKYICTYTSTYKSIYVTTCECRTKLHREIQHLFKCKKNARVYIYINVYIYTYMYTTYPSANKYIYTYTHTRIDMYIAP